MPTSSRFNEDQLLHMASLAKHEHTTSGYVHVKSFESSGRWQHTWASLYQNLLFFFESEESSKPTGAIYLEHSTCERLCMSNLKDTENKNCFSVTVPAGENQKHVFTLRTNTDRECTSWINAIDISNFAEVQSGKAEMEKKYNHILQILESEKTGKWQLFQQCEEQSDLVKSLKAELAALRKEQETAVREEESEEIKHIKKVQSLIRGWLCRRRWHNIVQNYIRSPHAESMRTRNNICFQLVESEQEYVENLSTLVSCFYRPLKMAASSKRPPLTHDEVNSIFLNSETILFLHQIFLKGLLKRIENWPTLMLGDLFDMLLPMLSIYREYVRNYHYSLQTLTECKQRSACKRLFKMYEEKNACAGRTLDAYLTHPMHRIPAYIITLHQLLAHTPHDHVERKALDNAQSALEELSMLMHDEVSETENIRKNLSIERQIAEGCEMLLDVNQIFIRQGDLVQITEKAKIKGFLKSCDSKKEALRHCFLFSGYLLLTTRSSSGRFHLSKNGSGTVPLVETALVEDCAEEDGDCESVGSVRGCTQEKELNELSFKLLVKSKEREGPAVSIVLVAPSAQEKVAWISDISQCIENLMLSGTEDSSVTKQNRLNVKTDQRLFTDDVDIKYCKALNACGLPKIRYASLDRLLERLLDLRFLSIDFLNTFLITHRVFTSSEALLDTMRNFLLHSYSREASAAPYGEVFSPTNKKERSVSLPTANLEARAGHTKTAHRNSGSRKKSPQAPRPSITVSDVKMPTDEDETTVIRQEGSPDRLCPNVYHSYRRHSSPSALGETEEFEFPSSPDGVTNCPPDEPPSRHSGRRNQSSPFLSRGTVRARAQSSSSDFGSHNESRSFLETWSCITASPEEERASTQRKFLLQSPPKRRSRNRAGSPRESAEISGPSSKAQTNTPSIGASSQGFPPEQDSAVSRAKRKMMNAIRLGTTDSTTQGEEILPKPPRSPQRGRHFSLTSSSSSAGIPPLDWLETSSNEEASQDGDAANKNKRPSSPCRLYKLVKESEERITNMTTPTPRRQKSPSTSPLSSPRCPRSPLSPSANAGVVVTSSKPSRRRSSISVAAAAFAAATAGASSPATVSGSSSVSKFRFGHAVQHILSNHDSRQATMRVLTVLRHWVTKYAEDFAEDVTLKEQLTSFMNELLGDEETTVLEQKFASVILRTLNKKHAELQSDTAFENSVLSSSGTVDPASFDKFATTQLAEQLTFLGHWYFNKIHAREFLNLSWMKEDKCERAPNILRVSQRFNETSRLVASEILRRPTPSTRAVVIDKWANVAEVCRNLHNFNSVLEITSAFMSSSVFRLKKTWEKVSKQTRNLIDRLQKLVSAEGRFKNLRDALRHADGPCIPYLGFYLTDLAFIEDGTPDCDEDGLTNFSKMRMIAQVIQEIRNYQQVTHEFCHEEKVIQYLLSKELLMDEDMLYRTSLLLEPRKRTSSKIKHTAPETENLVMKSQTKHYSV